MSYNSVQRHADAVAKCKIRMMQLNILKQAHDTTCCDDTYTLMNGKRHTCVTKSHLRSLPTVTPVCLQTTLAT